MNERRQHHRENLSYPIVAMPVLPDGRLAVSDRVHGRCVDRSTAGIRIVITTAKRFAAESLVVGVDQGDDLGYGGLTVTHRLSHADGLPTVGGFFGGPADRLIRSKAIIPRFDPDARTFTHEHSSDVLKSWCEAGLLEAVLVDRVQVCPRCQALPTFRLGCRRCASGRTCETRLIHHFACAHTGPAQTFEAEDQLKCPKCRTPRLIIGADYEYLSTYRCLDCHWTESARATLGHCLGCNHRFFAEEAHEQDLIAYRLRVRPLAQGHRLTATSAKAVQDDATDTAHVIGPTTADSTRGNSPTC